VRERWATALKELQPKSTFARHDTHNLSGEILLGATVAPTATARTLEAARAVLRDLATSPVSIREFEDARRTAFAALNERKQQPTALADEWLDATTYNTTLADEERALNAMTTADVRRVAARIFAEAKFASVVAGDAMLLRNELARLSGGIEVLKVTASTAPATPSEPSKRP
jgi:predicted Zn-dependent peptidase